MKEWTLPQFTAWLQGKTDMLVCVTGPTGSGKSTFVSNLGSRYAFKAALPGKAVRAQADLIAKVAASKNPTAAPELEQYVRAFVQKRVEKAGTGRSVAVDGMPRTVEQVLFCVDMAYEYKKKLVFAYLDLPRPLREARLSVRGDKSDKLIMHKRLDNDEKVLPDVMARMVQVVHGGKLGFFFLINTGGSCDKKETTGEKIRTAEGELDTTFRDGNRIRKPLP